MMEEDISDSGRVRKLITLDEVESCASRVSGVE